MRRVAIVLTALFVITVAAGCGKKAKGSGKPRVAVSIFPLYDVTRRIAGDRLEVMLVLPPGKSEHGYDPTPKEIARLEGAKLGLAVGLDMDGWVENIIKSAGGTKVVRLGDKVKTMPIDVEPIEEGEAHEHEHEGEEHGHEGHTDKETPEQHDKLVKEAVAKAPHEGHSDKETPDEHAKLVHEEHEKHEAAEKAEHEEHEHHHELGAPDPHFWLDPDRMMGVADSIAAELTAIDPEGKDTYAKNAETLKASLKTLDDAIAARSKAWSKHTIVTFHGSMAYFAKRYNITIAAVVEPIAGKEPTAAYIAEVIHAIKIGKAAALFIEPQLDRGPGDTIAKEAGIPLGELDPVGGVKGRDSYESLMTWNTDQLEKSLK